MYSKTTKKINITVKPYYLEDQSEPEDQHYVWAYQVTIDNQGKEKVAKGIDSVKNTASNAMQGIRNRFNMTGGALSDSEKSQYQEYIDNCMKDGNEYLKKLYLLVLVKDYVSEAMMLCLVGFLVITKSYNTIINFKCVPVNTNNDEDVIKQQQDKLNK